jgi:DNA polymerase-3 subunit delta
LPYYADFEKKVAAGKIEPVYFILVSDSYFLNKAGELLRKKIFGSAKNDENYFQKYGDESDTDEIIELCRNFSSLFTTHKVVIVKKCEKLGKKISELKEYFEKPDRDTTLLLAFDKEYALEKKLDKELKFYDFTEIPDEQYRLWIKDLVTQNGCSIEESAIDVLIDSVPRYFDLVCTEISKICNYFDLNSKEPKIITSSIILKFIGYDAEFSPYDLMSAVIQNDHKKSLDILNNLLNVSRINEVFLLSIISGFYMDMLASGKDFDRAGKNDYYIKYKFWGEKLKFIQLHYKYIKNKDFSVAFNRIMETDIKLKTSKIEPAVLMTTLIQELTNI